MSTQPVILTIIISFALFGCAKKPAETLIGEWKETDSTGKTTSLVLNADKSFKLVQGNLVLDGATVSGKSEWRLDTSREPMSLDLVITLPTGQQETLPMIVRLITERKLQLRMGEDMKTRPNGFSAQDDKNQVILEKQ